MVLIRRVFTLPGIKRQNLAGLDVVDPHVTADGCDAHDTNDGAACIQSIW